MVAEWSLRKPCPPGGPTGAPSPPGSPHMPASLNPQSGPGAAAVSTGRTGPGGDATGPRSHDCVLVELGPASPPLNPDPPSPSSPALQVSEQALAPRSRSCFLAGRSVRPGPPLPLLRPAECLTITEVSLRRAVSPAKLTGRRHHLTPQIFYSTTFH